MLHIYTDGSGGRANNPTGSAFIVVDDDDEISYQEMENFGLGTSNTAELNAFIMALRWLHTNNIQEAVIFTDSQYVEKGYNEWMEMWIEYQFAFTKNADLWREINKYKNKLFAKVNIKVTWIKGHVKGEIYNNYVDRLAYLARTNCKQTK